MAVPKTTATGCRCRHSSRPPATSSSARAKRSRPARSPCCPSAAQCEPNSTKAVISRVERHGHRGRRSSSPQRFHHGGPCRHQCGGPPPRVRCSSMTATLDARRPHGVPRARWSRVLPPKYAAGAARTHRPETYAHLSHGSGTPRIHIHSGRSSPFRVSADTAASGNIDSLFQSRPRIPSLRFPSLRLPSLRSRPAVPVPRFPPFRAERPACRNCPSWCPCTMWKPSPTTP